ncbi:metal ABC transporter solute-binding protein [Lacticaseibacillus saniviri]|nr:metal ABC transporter solute-binding protein [Lacticaseibacillus saniviri]
MHKRFWGIGAALLILVTFLGACQQAKPASEVKKDGITVVASVDFYGEVAKAVLGDHGKVTSIINRPEVDPHDYEPTTAVGKDVAKANVVLANGIGYDGWMDKLVKANSNGATYIRVGEDVLHKKEGDNEHLWYQPTTMKQLATQLAKEFGKIDKANAKAFDANAKKYIATLTPMTDLVAKLKAERKQSLVDVSEPVFDYALDSLGYKVNNEHFSKATEDGTDPSPADIEAMKKDIRDKKIAFFVQNTQADSKIVDQLTAEAKKAGVPVLKVTETLPKDKTYLSWMMSQYQALEKIQDNEKK